MSEQERSGIDRIESAVEEIRRGGMVIVVDDEDRENEGDLILAAQRITPEAICFLERFGRGLLCAPMTAQRLATLQIPLLERGGGDRYRTRYTVPVDAARGITTGISARDRTVTIRRLVDANAGPRDFIHGGHVQPLCAAPGGVLQRAGHTEAAVDLATLAGFPPVGVLCEIKRDDGEMMRLPELKQFAAEHRLKLISIADLIEYRSRHERLIERVAACDFPTEVGDFRLIAYEATVDSSPFLALVKGEIRPDEPTLVRMHSECLTGDGLFSRRCDCGQQLRLALERIEAEGSGVLVHVAQEGRGIGLLNKIRAYELQDHGLDTVEANERLGFKADLRDYGLGAQVLLDLGVRKMRLMTNNWRKIVALEGYGLEVVEQVPLIGEVTADNVRYLAVKREKLGHLLPETEADEQEEGEQHG